MKIGNATLDRVTKLFHFTLFSYGLKKKNGNLNSFYVNQWHGVCHVELWLCHCTFEGRWIFRSFSQPSDVLLLLYLHFSKRVVKGEDDLRSHEMIKIHACKDKI